MGGTNPTYRLEILDRHDVAALLEAEQIQISELTPQTLSNIVRARLLVANGGIWVDASLFPVRPLDVWLPALLTGAGFFAFARPKPDRLISDWFLVATPDNPILRELWREIRRFWAKPRHLKPGIPEDPVASVSSEVAAATDTYPYFWFHYLFELVVRTRPDIASLWENCVRSPADNPHQLQFLFRDNVAPSDAEIMGAVNAAPVQKLNWRASYPLDLLTALD